MAEPTGVIRPQPRNAALGAIADALARAHTAAARVQFNPQIAPQFTLADLLPLEGAAGLMQDVAAYGPRAINRGGPTLQTFRLDPRALDVAEAATYASPLTRLARPAGRMAAQQVERAMSEGRGPLGAALAPVRPLNVIKPKGGNWLAGDYSPEAVAQRLKTTVVGMEPAERVPMIEGLIREQETAGAVTPEFLDRMRAEQARLTGEAAINKWLDQKLAKYIRNEMATPEDPLRALIQERGVSHLSLQDLRESAGNIPSEVAQARKQAGFPELGLVEESTGLLYGDLNDLQRAASGWETLADAQISPNTAERMLSLMKIRPANPHLRDNPWLAKVPPGTPVYGVADRPVVVAEGLGFDHLVDELRNAMDPNSTLPRNLRIDPKDIDKITVPQAVERVAKINAWRAEEAARAEKAGMLENLQATPRMADDSFELSFVDKPGGAWVDIPETVDDKGMKLCNSIGKAGGWCTQAEWAAKSYGSGENRLTALVDTEGRPHAQAKITENDWPVSGEGFTRLDPQTKAQYSRYVREWRQRNPNVEELTDADVIQALKEAGVQGPAPDITELKPVGNSFSSERAQEYAKRDPDYFRKVENSVLKFLNNGNWGEVADLHHYGIVDLKEPNSLMDAMNTLYGDESNRRIGQEFIDAFNRAVSVEPNAPRFMTQRQLREFIGPVEPLEGYAEGGAVRTDPEGEDQAGVDRMVQQETAATGGYVDYADGGAVKRAARSLGELAERYAGGGAVRKGIKGLVEKYTKRAPQDEALETARKNAVTMLGLPENNTAMDRARAMGFDVDAYHGTGRSFPEFKTGQKSAHAPYADPSDVFWFVDNPLAANSYAMSHYYGGNPNIMPVMLRSGAQFKKDMKYRGPEHLPTTTPDIFAQRKLKKADSVMLEKFVDAAIPGYPGGGTHIAVQDPARIRSRFAAFDPARVNEADLLGFADPRLLGLTAAGTAAGLGLRPLFARDEEKQEPQKKAEGGIVRTEFEYDPAAVDARAAALMEEIDAAA